MSDPRPDEPPPEWLAAYADGELTARERARVESWLANHPEAREQLEAQESLGPGNAGFWRVVEPPAPPAAEWARVRLAVQGAHRARPKREWAGRLATIALIATAASLFLVLSGSEPVEVRRPAAVNTQPDPPAAVEPYAMASNDDVQIISLPESSADMLVVGQHPLHGSSMALAKFGEVEFYGVGSDLAGRFPEVPTETSDEEIPMIWAPRAP